MKICTLENKNESKWKMLFEHKIIKGTLQNEMKRQRKRFGKK